MSSIPPPPDSSRETLMQALEAAQCPSALSDERHEAILAKVLGFAPAASAPAPFAEPSLQQQQEAELLALALEGRAQHELAEFALALANAHCPGELSELGLARALRAVTAPSRPQAGGAAPSATASRWLKLTLGSTAAALALAATVTLFWRFTQPMEEPLALRHQPQFASSRSLSPLFVATANQGTTTERMDRIVMARSRDLRHNRYLTWRVR